MTSSAGFSSSPSPPHFSFPPSRRAAATPLLPTDIRLLLVEDSEFDGELLLREFRKAGFNPVYCRVDDKVSLDEVLLEKWDLAITDYQLPGFDGLAAVMTLQ
ncbi:hypothetical protein MNBD_GAMMA20-1192, partial [hydrothermal vent metagenome]